MERVTLTLSGIAVVFLIVGTVMAYGAPNQAQQASTLPIINGNAIVTRLSVDSFNDTFLVASAYVYLNFPGLGITQPPLPPNTFLDFITVAIPQPVSQSVYNQAINTATIAQFNSHGFTTYVLVNPNIVIVN